MMVRASEPGAFMKKGVVDVVLSWFPADCFKPAEGRAANCFEHCQFDVRHTRISAINLPSRKFAEPVRLPSCLLCEAMLARQWSRRVKVSQC